MECVLRWLDEIDCSLFAMLLVWHGEHGWRWRRVALLLMATLSMLLAPGL
jgi:hypothetical protein